MHCHALSLAAVLGSMTAGGARLPLPNATALAHNRLCRYDINCRYGPHLKQAVQAGSYTDEVKQAALSLQTPVPPFHCGMHNAQCQATNSSIRCAPDAGAACKRAHLSSHALHV